MPSCDDCGSTHLVVGPDHCLVCTSCGLIKDGAVEWSDDRSLAGAGHGKRDAPSGCAVQPGSRGRQPPPSALASQINRALKRDARAKVRTVQLRWLSELRNMAQRANLSGAISDVAVEVYRDAISRSDWKNRKHDNQLGILVACLFHACNISKAHRTPAELCGFLGVDQKCARRMVKLVQRAADTIRKLRNDKTHGIFLPAEVVPRCAQRMNLPDRDKMAVVIECGKLYEITRNFIDNHRPETICAGLISASARRLGVSVAQDEIAHACLISVNTVRIMTAKIDFVLGPPAP